MELKITAWDCSEAEGGLVFIFFSFLFSCSFHLFSCAFHVRRLMLLIWEEDMRWNGVDSNNIFRFLFFILLTSLSSCLDAMIVIAEYESIGMRFWCHRFEIIYVNLWQLKQNKLKQAEQAHVPFDSIPIHFQFICNSVWKTGHMIWFRLYILLLLSFFFFIFFLFIFLFKCNLLSLNFISSLSSF